MMKLVILACKLNVKRLCKAVAEIVRCAALKSLAVMHESFDGVCILGSGETFFCSLNALYNRHCKIFLAELGIYVEHSDCFFLSLLGRCMDRVTFLPKEFSCTQERTCCLFPANNAYPLIVELRKISV